MKKLLFLAIAMMALTSCKKCYKCKYTTTTYYNGAMQGSPTVVNKDFCGTKKQKTEFEQSLSSIAHSGGAMVMSTCSCQ